MYLLLGENYFTLAFAEKSKIFNLTWSFSNVTMHGYKMRRSRKVNFRTTE